MTITIRCIRFIELIKNTIIYDVLTVIVEELLNIFYLTGIYTESKQCNIDFTNLSYVKESIIKKNLI